MQSEHIAVIILAAGQSARFGAVKMTHVLDNGKTILNTCVEQYQKSFANVNVVIPNATKLHQGLTGLDVNIVVSNHTAQGMSQSLIAGVKSQPNADAWLIALGDMPYVQAETASSLAEKATTANIVVPVCGHRRGNPVIFGRDFYSQLMSLQGDVGASQLIKANSSLVLKVLVGDKGVLTDIDRPEDIL